MLLDEWVPPGNAQQDSPSAEQALARLAEKYFTARGPATVADFAWWAGITKGDARDGLGRDHPPARDGDGPRRRVLAGAGLSRRTAKASSRPSVHLLPGFDEYMLGYTDRSIQLGERKRDYGSTVSANGMFSSTLVIDGRVEGTWRRTLRKDHVDINVTPFRKLKHAETDALAVAAERYGRSRA